MSSVVKRFPLLFVVCIAIIAFNILMGIYHRVIHLDNDISLYLTIVTIAIFLNFAGRKFFPHRPNLQTFYNKSTKHEKISD